MPQVLCLTLFLCLFASSASAGGLEIGEADVAFDPCTQQLPAREDYLKTVIGSDGDAVYDMQVKYHSWLCNGAGPTVLALLPGAGGPVTNGGNPPQGPLVLADYSDDDKLHFVFPDTSHYEPSPVPLPVSGLLLTFALGGLGVWRAMRKVNSRGT